jgi:hypothetical protein
VEEGEEVSLSFSINVKSPMQSPMMSFKECVGKMVLSYTILGGALEQMNCLS